MKIFLAGLLAAGLSSSVLADDWVQTGGNSNMVVSVNTKSIAKSPVGRKAWVRYVYIKPEQYNGKTYGKTLDLTLFNCAERTTGVTQEILYGGDNDDTVIHSASVPLQRVGLVDVAPGTVIEAVLEFVCDQKLGKK